MNGPADSLFRMRLLQGVVLLVFALLIGRLAWLQLFDERYEEMAKANVLRHVVLYPPRGEVLDRNGEFLVQSRECYDLMVIAREIDKRGFDTVRLCEVLNIPIERVRRELANARMRPRAPRLVASYIAKEDKLRFDECNFRGFYTVYRTVRRYPRKVGGNLLGFVSEVTAEYLKRHPYYQAGDYVGLTGVESAYETVLRGNKGVKIQEIDTHGEIKGSYMDGHYDSLPDPGRSIVSTIDARLQLLGEELMRGKVGAAVAIEPSTGEILMMVSSPTYDPDELVGRQRGNNYMRMLRNKRRPLFNRAVKAKYPPGSTFKVVQGLIGLQEGVLRPSDLHECHMGYQVGRQRMACHAHSSPLDLRFAVATSCNAYFCYVFRDILDNPKYGGVKEGFDVWKEYVHSFGFGRKLGSDFLDEGHGYVPNLEFYNRRYRRSWNSLTLLSLSIGQGELGCTPLQLANLAAIVANRGYYYIPHIVRRIEGQDSLDARFYERHYTMVDPKYFEPIVDGMWRGVNVAGTSTDAYLEGWDVCGKTGTAQNPHGKDHSTFLSFAPRNNPRIAISVYVENGGYGAAAALPIASLLEEFYLTDTIRRPELLQRIKNMNIYYPSYDR
ncbi:penicillin-binding protein 2 [uncultured Alistipes sp.]|jgi:penicillin-binding protein 2|uniref:peptidoglycan D,D-transpeptidase FtsI family protein n=1 Tax=uncultured Alistipes sp. TaxID=538949 RepID=UPI00272B50EB|nr:penicillin-binding transpeptidase domain-containing protein [uncultured Alistipes sp.]